MFANIRRFGKKALVFRGFFIFLSERHQTASFWCVLVFEREDRKRGGGAKAGEDLLEAAVRRQESP
jgi:hypothetical protein